MNKGLKIIENYLLLILVLFSPILVLPIFPDFYNTPKLVFFSAIAAIILLVKSAEVIANQRLEIKLGNLDFPVLTIALSYIIAGAIKSPNKMEAFFFPGTATMVATLALFYFFTNQDEINKKIVSRGLLISGSVVSLVSIISILKLNQKLTFLPQFAKVDNFSLVGSNFLTFLFLAMLIPLALDLLINDSKIIRKIAWGLSLVIITAAMVGNLYLILPGKPLSPKFPPLKVSWEIAIDAIKDSPLLGVGAGNYLTAFNRFRSLTYNNLDIWQIKFTNSQNYYIHHITETGLFGIFAIIMLGFAIFRILVPTKTISNHPQHKDEEIELDFKKIGLGVAVLALLFSGPYLPTLLVFFTYLSLNSKTKKITFSFEAVQKEQRQTSIMASSLIGLPIIIAVLFFLYTGSKTVYAEYTYKRGLDAIPQNKGQEAFNLIAKAINKNPRVDRYHASLAQISFLAAQNIAGSKEANQITDEEKGLITNLIQQAISEGKATVSLNPQRADNWELLGNLYKQIMAFAQGSDTFAVQSLSQAVALDPINPITRISLGGVYFAIGDYESAIDVFKLAVAAKPNYANARYNLAVAYREKGDLDKALAEMNNTLSLLEEGSNDRKIVEEEIKNIESKKKEGKTETKTEELTPPTKPESALEPKVNLPEEAAPPSPVATPDNQEKEPNPTPPTENQPQP